MKGALIPQLAIAVLLFAAAGAFAQPYPMVEWPVAEGGNGHFYQYVEVFEPTRRFAGWVKSRDDAAALTFQGLPGHLATVTSESENRFIYDRVPRSGGEINAWLGGYQLDSSPTPAVGWRWVTGEAWVYTAWAGATSFSGPEPNDFATPQENGEEQWLQLMFYRPDNIRAGLWNDALTDASGYVVEYELPEPSSHCALIVSYLFLARRRLPGP